MTKLLSILTALFVLCISSSDVFARHYHRHHIVHKHASQLKIAKRLPIIISAKPTQSIYVSFGRSGRTNIVSVFTADPTVVMPTTVGTFINTSRNKRELLIDGQQLAVRKEDIEGPESISLAAKYVGFSAKANKKDLMDLFKTTLHQVVDPTVTPWCAAFVNAMLSKLDMKGTNSLAASSFTTWGKQTTSPKKSDIVLLHLSNKPALDGITHVTFYIDTVEIHGIKYVKVLGGNQEHSVKVSYYPISTVVQYRTLG
jgi:uncharacterized protein (TIGR02594 family)